VLPTVKLPADLDQLIRERSETVDAHALSNLYDPNAVVLHLDNYWIRGRAAIRDFLGEGGLYRLRPVYYSIDRSAAVVAGTFINDKGAAPRAVGNFHLTARRGPRGIWRIMSETFTERAVPSATEVAADSLIRELDQGEVQRATVLSLGYLLGSPLFAAVTDEYGRVRAENDWVSQQAARYPDRLVATCGINPLKDYAITEVHRCAKLPQARALKMHVANSQLNMLDAAHVTKLREVFAAANASGLAIIIHLWKPAPYGREHSEAFLSQVVPSAPNVPVQIAHMGASGPSYHADRAVSVFAEAAAAGDLRMRNVYVDVASMVVPGTPDEDLELIATRLRQFGMGRILFGSDRSPGAIDRNEGPGAAWLSFRRLPLTEEEFATIAANVAPYFRGRPIR
jgi:predicted TIM-barrel fold metal-dependent hydrolase